jgi:hypothetical protein
VRVGLERGHKHKKKGKQKYEGQAKKEKVCGQPAELLKEPLGIFQVSMHRFAKTDISHPDDVILFWEHF